MIVMYSLKNNAPEYEEYLDKVGDYIQHCGGEFHLARHEVEFTFEEKHRVFVLLQFPFLKEIPLCY
jgi:uncharacterized protein (DUF1330 family)